MNNTNLERCRMCLAQNHTLIPLSTLNVIRLSDMFMAWASTQIRPKHKISQFVCTECVTLAEKAYIFKRLQEKPISKPALFIPDENLETIVRPQTPVEIKCETVEHQGENNLEKPISKPALFIPDENLDTIVRLQTPVENECETVEVTVEHQVENDLEMIDIKSVEILEEIKPEKFSCTNCVAIFTDADELSKHNLAHEIEPKILSVKKLVMYSCRECFIDIETPDDFIEHCFTLHESSIENLRYLCKLCATELPNLCQLGAHVNRMHKKKSVPLVKGPKRLSRTSTWPQTCDYCQSRLKSLHEKIVHHNEAHSDLKKFNCDKCEKKFFHKIALKRHSEIHKVINSHVCQYCGRSFTMNSYLEEHIRIHTGEKPFKCNECNARFSRRGGLRSHMYVHATENNLECTECHKKFKRPRSLKRHIRAHASDAPTYSCHLCPKQFKWSNTLKRHLTIHSNECFYACKVCEKVFNRMGNLKVHMKTHTGEKPYVCTICKKAFGYAHCLRSHTAKCHTNGTLQSQSIE